MWPFDLLRQLVESHGDNDIRPTPPAPEPEES